MDLLMWVLIEATIQKLDFSLIFSYFYVNVLCEKSKYL